jgi:hypothetical protein
LNSDELAVHLEPIHMEDPEHRDCFGEPIMSMLDSAFVLVVNKYPASLQIGWLPAKLAKHLSDRRSSIEKLFPELLKPSIESDGRMSTELK